MGLDVAGGEIRHFHTAPPQDGALPQDLVSTRARGPVVAGAQTEGPVSQWGAVQFCQVDHPTAHGPAQIEGVGEPGVEVVVVVLHFGQQELLCNLGLAINQGEVFLEATDRDPIWRDFFYTELTTGLRLGEICGLMWSDFDGRKGTLSISRTLRKEKGGRLVAGDTKTYAGTRTILLPTSTAERLRLRKKTSYSPWIFHDPLRPETLLNPGTAYRQLKKVLQETGLPELRFHDLRHTFATHALASGVDAKTLSGILGHTKASFTLDTYTHTTGDMQRRAAEIVGGFLTDYLGEEMAPWQNAENTATAASV